MPTTLTDYTVRDDMRRVEGTAAECGACYPSLVAEVEAAPAARIVRAEPAAPGSYCLRCGAANEDEEA